MEKENADKTLPYGKVMNQLLSKTQPDGTYIDPEDGTKYNMKDPYDRAEATDVEVMKLEEHGYKITM